MNIRVSGWLPVAVSLMGIASAWAQPATNAVLETQVTGFSVQQGVAALSAGRAEGVELGDRFWIFRDDAIDASGQIQVVTAEGSAGAIEDISEVKPGGAVTILKSAALPQYREGLPPGVTIRGHIERVAPGRRNAWLDMGARSGLQTGDTLLIRRLSPGNVAVPLARGRIEVVREDTALALLEPLVGNTLPQPGDIAELWPSPADRRLGRIESMVLEAQPASEPEGDLLLTIVGGARDGLEKGRLVDLFHGRDYIGHAIISDVGEQHSRALVINAGRRLRAGEGDRAWVRPPPGPPVRPLAAAVFKVASAGDTRYALIAAGEIDGVKDGEKFIIRHEDPADPTVRKDIAELTIQKVENDYSTAIIRPLSADPDDHVRLWDFAERRDPMPPDWRAIGIVGRVVPESRSAVAELEPRSEASVGRVVRLIPEDPSDPDEPPRPAGAAIVIHRSGETAILYVPPGWGRVGELLNARVELADEPKPPGGRRRGPAGR